jgi:FkbM family methyltransferase
MNLKEYLKNPLGIEENLLELFNRESDLIIFDIGCCEAEETIRYSRIFPRSMVYSFEPVLENYEISIQNINEYGLSDRCKIFNIALSNFDGESDFYVSQGNPGDIIITQDWRYGNKSSSLLKPREVLIHYPWLNFDVTKKIQTKKLKTFCHEQSIESIDYIHMDVQGAELMVLEGADDFLKNIKCIRAEFEDVELYEGQPLKNNLIEFLESNNFTIIKETLSHLSGDLLAVKK